MGDGGNFMKKKGTSSYNPKEAKYVAKVVESCQRQLPCKEIGIITFYTAQVEEIQNALKKAKCGELNKIRVSSVDSFQGGEADIIILSFVRAPESQRKKGGVGFVNDFRRLNVALTRAKSTLIMLGHAKTLGQEEGSALKALIKDARSRGHFYEENKLRERLMTDGAVDNGDKRIMSAATPVKEIGIITFYTAQVEEIQNALKKAKLRKFNEIRVSSVDSFQGGEADIIILSFVRAPDSKRNKGRVGFVNDFRRLNVALTRAKSTLIMLGHANTLGEKGTALKALIIIDAKSRGHFYEENKLRERLISQMTDGAVDNGDKTTKLTKAPYADLTTETSSLSIGNEKLDRQESSTASSVRVNTAPSTQGKKSAKGKRRFFRSPSGGAKQYNTAKNNILVTRTICECIFFPLIIKSC
eukprot:CAMPEP_0185042452 /NCGR_PEP_ID=MMETSP1103-20130426/42363_1 /TAXON_ID=36769 /ORGANISM="Paraphysomonas bandaiensis, Strain Caron Lab Isolate" /LENGTH=413 /DNA_ID=CAMNT_0027582529 /DNA_START=33 /DNA_END=1275 /DNA_ORIENTATION=-